MKKIAIVTDSSADISIKKALEENIYVVRLPINIDGVEYEEEVDIELAEVLEKMKSGKVCKTSQASAGYICALWDEILKTHDEIIYLPISSGLSGAYQTGLMCAKDYNGKVIVIDGKHACYPQQLLIKQIKLGIEKGMTSLEIKEVIEKNGELWAVLIPSDLVYLKRGGRISAAASVLGNLLKIVPLLKVEHGKIDVLAKVRTHQKAYNHGMDECLNVENLDDYTFAVLHAGAPEKALELKAILEARINRPVEFDQIYPVIASHTGPGTIAFGRIKKVIR